MSAHENTAAFPYAVPVEFTAAEPGMTLRDWFASQALPAIIGATSSGTHQPLRAGESVIEAMARDAYEFADAMLSERSKP